MNYTEYQKSIFNFVEKQSDNGIVNACPGGGKTSTIVESCKYIKQGRTLLCSFGKMIADTLAKKVPFGVESATLNALGFRMLKENLNVRFVKVNKYKDKNILQNFVDEKDFYKINYNVDRMIGLLKNNLIMDNVEEVVRQTIIYHGFDIPEAFDNGRFESIVAQVYERSIKEIDKEISFDDQKFVPVMRNMSFKKFDTLLVDEAQDLSPLDVSLVEKLGKRKIFVGDKNQCQPPGTMIQVVTEKYTKFNESVIEEIPIEQIKKGDVVISWDKKYAEWRRTKKVLETASRPYEGELVVLTTADGLQSKYTVNHKCIVNFSDLRNQYCVYLMKQKDKFRIGISRMIVQRSNKTHSGNGPLTRLKKEDGDAIWILSIHDTHREAWLEEQIISAIYGIPQLLFNTTNGSKIFQSDINYVWNKMGDLAGRALKCLKYHGRKIDFPLFTNKDNQFLVGLTRPIITQACNILDGCMVLPHSQYTNPDHSHPEDWVPIIVTREKYNGFVHSLSIEDNQNYVADGLLTANSVYGFRGSLNNAMDEIKNGFNCIDMPLSICFRCSENVILEAQKVYSQIESPTKFGLENNNGQGSVDTIIKEKFRLLIQDSNDFVLCRTTAPLISECLKILPYKRAYVKGREIGEGLERLIKAVCNGNDLPIEDFQFKLDDYFIQQKERLAKLNRETALDELEDKVESLKALMINCNRVNDLVKLIQDVIVDNGSGIAFLSIHKSKGLENKNIYILRPDLIPHRRAKLDWQRVQENNLKFVAITRAQQNLRYVLKEDNEK